ncbi:hypothetical protein BLOT_010908 [Blomia tropicalis]|nr:hypothetical protein BLOT_010908 [Blomia tropicalis]
MYDVELSPFVSIKLCTLLPDSVRCPSRLVVCVAEPCPPRGKVANMVVQSAPVELDDADPEDPSALFCNND